RSVNSGLPSRNHYGSWFELRPETPRRGLEPGTSRLTAGSTAVVSKGVIVPCGEPLDRVAAGLPESAQTDPDLARVVTAWCKESQATSRSRRPPDPRSFGDLKLANKPVRAGSVSDGSAAVAYASGSDIHQQTGFCPLEQFPHKGRKNLVEDSNPRRR